MQLDQKNKDTRKAAQNSGDWYWDITKTVQKPDRITLYYQKRRVNQKTRKRQNLPASKGGTRKEVVEIVGGGI